MPRLLHRFPQVLLEPYWYICQKPGKAVRAHLIAVRDLVGLRHIFFMEFFHEISNFLWKSVWLRPLLAVSCFYAIMNVGFQ